MKIIIYGIYNTSQRIQVEKELGNTHEVIGYMQYGCSFLMYEYRPFIVFEDLYLYSYDVIVILANSAEENNEGYLHLKEYGVDCNKMLQYYYFSVYQGGISFRNPVKDYMTLNMRFCTWIFGMSYAVRGIYVHYLDNSAYKFCSPGMDLHYHCQVLKKLMFPSPSKNEFPNRIILELPYYIFNFDLSMTKKNKIRMFNLYEDFCDWHNFGQKKEDFELLNEYQLFTNLFRDKKERNRTAVSNNIEVWPVKYMDVTKITEESFKNLKMWTKLYPSTINENKRIFYNILEQILSWNPSIKIYILVMPHSKYEYEYCKELIEKMKKIFYSIMKEGKHITNYKIFDCYKLYFEHDEYFLDIEHLNTLGGIEFSKYLNNILEND